MSFSYSGDPSTSPLDECRFILGDTNADTPILQDEEIAYLIDTYGSNVNVRNYQLFMRASTLFSRDIRRSLGPQSEDPTSRLDFFKSQADYYKSLIVASGISVPKYAYPKTFRKGMHSNPPWPSPRR